MNTPPATTTSFRIAGFDKNAGGRFVRDTTSREKLAWNHRVGQWARYVVPLTSFDGRKEVEDQLERLELPVEPQQSLALEADNVKELLSATDASEFPVDWPKSLKWSTVAHFGSILHSQTSTVSPPPPPELLAINHPRVFSTITPHPFHLAKFDVENQKTDNVLVQNKFTIVIRFWPTPYLDPALNQQTKKVSKYRLRGTEGVRVKKNIKAIKQKRLKGYEPKAVTVNTPKGPIIELRLLVVNDEVKGVESVRAIRQTHITDVMLPASSVDVRFTQEEYGMLRGEPAGFTAWEPVSQFLDNAVFDVPKNKFEMPPRQKFPIPRRFFSDYPPSPFQPQPETPLDPDELVSTDYTFVGLELRKAVSMPYHGFTLTYTSVDARRGGGNRTEISLEPTAANTEGISLIKRMPPQENSKLHDDFLALCRKFAGAETLWSGDILERV